MINIVPILKNKKEFLELLLLADEQESMIDLYLERGEMFALYDGDLKAACVITDEGNVRNKEHCNLSALSAQRIWNTVDKVSAGALQRPLSDDVSGHRRQYLYHTVL